jgi:hypothetical protein
MAWCDCRTCSNAVVALQHAATGLLMARASHDRGVRLRRNRFMIVSACDAEERNLAGHTVDCHCDERDAGYGPPPSS